jgi:hypothetical protein
VQGPNWVAAILIAGNLSNVKKDFKILKKFKELLTSS